VQCRMGILARACTAIAPSIEPITYIMHAPRLIKKIGKPPTKAQRAALDRKREKLMEGFA
jgi:hypothetical protein